MATFTWSTLSSLGGLLRKIASSSDGTILYAVFQGLKIYKSTDSGATWSQLTNSGAYTWRSICCSSDGTKIYASAYSGDVYKSNDSGATWSSCGTLNYYNGAIGCSSDGSKIIVLSDGEFGSNNGYCYTSTDSGANWTQRTGIGSARYKSTLGDGLFVSSDFSVIIALVYGTNYARISTDEGVNWSNYGSSISYYGIFPSVDKSKLLRVLAADNFAISTDSGSSWGSTITIADGMPAGISNNGSTIATGRDYNDKINISVDGGASFETQAGTSNKAWGYVFVAPDGSYIICGTNDDETWYRGVAPIIPVSSKFLQLF